MCSSCYVFMSCYALAKQCICLMLVFFVKEYVKPKKAFLNDMFKKDEVYVSTWFVVFHEISKKD